MGRKTGRTNPRKKSWRVGNLSWVLTREAALCIMLPFERLPDETQHTRAMLCDIATYHVRRDAARLLRLQPWRRTYPQPWLFTEEEMRAAERRGGLPATTEPPTTAA